MNIESKRSHKDTVNMKLTAFDLHRLILAIDCKLNHNPPYGEQGMIEYRRLRHRCLVTLRYKAKEVKP